MGSEMEPFTIKELTKQRIPFDHSIDAVKWRLDNDQKANRFVHGAITEKE